MPGQKTIFITGATGFMGRALIPELLARGHRVRALVRAGSESKVPAGCEAVTGNPLDASTFEAAVNGADTFVQLLGVTHPNPRKAAEFRAIDFGSAKASLAAAVKASVPNFVYLSVAQPAPVMKVYVSVRAEIEQAIRDSGIHATFLRPWYVLGPGRRWPLLILPMYWLMSAIPSSRVSARRLGLVTREQMIASLVWAIENPAAGVRIMAVPDIRRGSL